MASHERDLFQPMMADPACLHCGSVKRLTKDHLVPLSRGDDGDAGNGEWGMENIVTCCAAGDSFRGNRDLMLRYRGRRRFPRLVMIRKYLKPCHEHASGMDLPDGEATQTPGCGMPFDPAALPGGCPDPEDPCYDWRARRI